MTSFMVSSSSSIQRFFSGGIWLAPVALLVFFGCDPGSLLSGPNTSLKAALIEAHTARSVSPLKDGSDLSMGLRKMMGRSLKSRLNRLTGQQQTLTAHVRISADDSTELSLKDELVLRVDGLGHWDLNHGTTLSELSEKNIVEGRRCLWSGDAFFTGQERGPMKAYTQWIDEPDRCLNSFQDHLSGVLGVFLERIKVDAEFAGFESGIEHIELKLSLDDTFEQHPLPLPMAWVGHGERTEAIWGPRDHLVATRSVLEQVEGQVTLERESGLFVEADLKFGASFKKMGRRALMTIELSLETTPWDGEVKSPTEFKVERRRQRVFKDRKALLGIPLPKSQGRSHALPAPGDAPRLVLTQTGALTTAPAKSTETKSKTADGLPPADDYDEDVPE